MPVIYIRLNFDENFIRMNYTELQQQLRSNYKPENKEFKQNLNGIDLHSCTFSSAMQIEIGNPESDAKAIFYSRDQLSEKNLHFTYPVFVPEGKGAENDVIILLHGLNERSWNKYLAWGYTLAKNTRKSVIMFPIAFHMNRSPEIWASPRLMSPYVSDRKRILPDTKDLSFANVALSERLTTQPQRFFLSGYQAGNDLLQLIDTIQSGSNPLFSKGTRINFFSYSVGVLLSQVLLVANPGKRFDNSRFVFFFGGSVVEGMQGISKYILDSQAFAKLIHFYREEERVDSKRSEFFNELMHQTLLGETFNALTTYKRLRKFKKNLFKKFKDRILTLTSDEDKIIPAYEINRTMKGSMIERVDFEYNFTHEVPFPEVNNHIRDVIDGTFDRIFQRVSLFLA